MACINADSGWIFTNELFRVAVISDEASSGTASKRRRTQNAYVLVGSTRLTNACDFTLAYPMWVERVPGGGQVCLKCIGRAEFLGLAARVLDKACEAPSVRAARDAVLALCRSA